MDVWTHVHFTAMGLQIASTIVGGGLSLKWLRVRNEHLEINTERLSLVKRFSVGLLWTLAVGFVLQLCYEAHLLS
jgi:hypothetical protein